MVNNIILFNFIFIIILFFSSNLIAKLLNLYDIPDKRKIHKIPIPIVGGLVIYFTVFLNFIIFDYINFYILLLSSFYFIIGLIDDAKKISANLRLVSLSIITFIFLNYFNQFSIKFLHIEGLGKIYLGGYSIIFTVLCILLFQNAMNMIDGLNGLSGSIFLIILIFILTKAGLEQDYLLLSILLLIFLAFNLNNKVFLGDSGIYFLSVYLALSLINISNNDIIYTEEIFLIMMLPGIDMLRLFIIRITNKKNPFKPDKHHLHHLLSNKFNSNIKTLLVLLLIYSVPIYLSLITEIETFYLIIFGLISYFILTYYLKGFKFYKNKK
tara:strand:+ start:173 stop:1147 length:975 start_codon:yes stop_codon:yes gene_type:complete